jgi:hypothetical protein
MEKMSLCLTKHYAIKTYGGVEVYIHVFLTTVLVEGEEISLGIHWIGGGVDATGGVAYMKKCKLLNLPELELVPSVVQPVASP